MLYKAVDFVGNTKDIDLGKRTAILKYATYKSLDRDKDRANKGMFTKSWNEGFSDIRFFKNHNKLEAPGKPVRFWEDDNHAYGEVKLGTHTLGEDVLKMMDEGIITNNSYGFDPLRAPTMANKGKDYKEVKLWEISVLTHWGAHPDSTVDSVTKAMVKLTKQLSADEQAVLRRIIANGNDNLKALVDLSESLDVDSDLYTYVNWYISQQSSWLGDAKGQLRYGLKEADAFTVHLEKMKAFVRNTSASDESIQEILLEIKSAEELLQTNNTALTHEDDDPIAPNVSVNKEFADSLTLLMLKY